MSLQAGVSHETITSASSRIAPHVRRTPLEAAPGLGDLFGAHMVLKCEHLQRTGSFKLRGATNALLALDESARRRGVVTASSGNHGQAVAHAARVLDIPCLVVVPEKASPTKVEAIRRQGATIQQTPGSDIVDAEVAGWQLAERARRAYIPPYNHPAVISGQGTVAVELLDQLDEGELEGLDAVIVAVGGGGLVSGIATYLSTKAPQVRIVGASPRNDAAMAASVAAGKIVTPPTRPTLSEGTAGSIIADSMTLPLCRALVDDWIDVSEDEIAEAIRLVLEYHHQLIEGAAGVAVAAARHVARTMPGSRIAVVSCGANLADGLLRQVLNVVPSEAPDVGQARNRTDR